MTLRSLDMAHYLLIIPGDIVYDTINQLGQYQLVHVNDCGDPSNRAFYQQSKRCDENIQRIETIKDALKKNNYDYEEYDEM